MTSLLLRCSDASNHDDSSIRCGASAVAVASVVGGVGVGVVGVVVVVGLRVMVWCRLMA
jgi:hypothetical protein